ncbi:MAG: radical SAM protein [Pseudomonadota bacterium]
MPKQDRLSAADIDAWRPAGPHFVGTDRRGPLRRGLQGAGQFGLDQSAGRFWPVACVALEVTQRCNLDCTLCYLSEHAEMAHDVPLAVLRDRVAMIAEHYGPGTSVQLTGGDPSLRAPADLEALCRAIRGRGLRSCLMTNGIKASRELLARLAAAGLDDVAFHVDVTQQRRGYPDEASLDGVRRAYLARARGLGLRVLFNTTICAANLHEVVGLARFFRAHAGEIALASFQLQAETGRGTARPAQGEVSRAAVMRDLEAGMATRLHFDVTAVGHRDCNRYTSVLVAGGEAVSLLEHRGLVHRLMKAFDTAMTPEVAYLDARRVLPRLARQRPWLVAAVLARAVILLWRLRRGLLRSRARAHRLALLVHDFMDADRLDRGRCESCVFMVATRDGPISMCLHNARRDAHVFAASRLGTGSAVRWWDPVRGRAYRSEPAAQVPETTPKQRKGRRPATTGASARRTPT